MWLFRLNRGNLCVGEEDGRGVAFTARYKRGILVAEAGWETFKLSELRLDEKNYRLGDQNGQRAAIIEMINDQKKKLVNLASDLMKMGASPGEPVWVTKDSKNRGQYIVLEGNRRVTALKLLETPALADGTIVETHFRNLARLYAKNPIRQLEAKIFASREEAASSVVRNKPASGRWMRALIEEI